MCILLIPGIDSTDSLSQASMLQAKLNRNGSVFPCKFNEDKQFLCLREL